MFKPKVLEYFSTVEDIDFNRNKIKSLHHQKLEKLIIYCYKNVPYYQDVLEDAQVVKNKNNICVQLENFSKIPVLTKEQVREHFHQLQSRDSSKRKTYRNSSGGSTGKPVVIIQDETYRNWNWANKLYYASMAGKEFGEPEIKLWGSRRDILQGNIGLKNRLINFIINRTLLNSFKMSERDIQKYFEIWNQVKPKLIWAYVESIYELAKFKNRFGIDVFSPHVIITTAGTLDEEMRIYIEETFGCNVLNQYGSREEGAIACECPEKKGLHIFEHSHHVEVVDEQNQPLVGNHGEIVVTNLHNYSMPLLRYSLEDIGIMDDGECACGRKFKKLSEVTGRRMSHFINPNGDIIHGLFFTHMFYYKDWIHKFKVVQEALDHIVIKIVAYGDPNSEDLDTFSENVKQVMGDECQVDFIFLKDLTPSDSGKFLFTESKVRNKRHLIRSGDKNGI